MYFIDIIVEICVKFLHVKGRISQENSGFYTIFVLNRENYEQVSINFSFYRIFLTF
jgi:hypothetical protein